MKKFKSIGCLLLVLAMVLALGACGGGDNGMRPAANTETLSAPKYEVTDKAVQVVVDEDFTGKDPETNTWARIAQSAKNHYGVELTPIVVPIDQQTTTILSLLASDDVPDIIETQKLPGWYPRMCSDGTFAAISDYVNFEDLLWKDRVETMSDYMIGDKYYALSLGAYTPVEIVYNKKLIKEAGLEDPVELYKKGEWTWAKLQEYIEKIAGDKDSDNRNDIFGADHHPMSHCYLTSMGTGITARDESGKFNLNPISSSGFEKLADFLNMMCRRQSIGYVPNVDGNDGTGTELLAEDKLVFSFVGRWIVESDPELSAKKDKGELALVMAPRHEDADDYYCYGVTSGYAVPSRGNVVGAIATLTATRLDDFPSAENLAKTKQKYIDAGWDENSAHILTYDIAAHEGSYQKVKLVSLGIDIFNTTLQTTVNDLLYDPLYKGSTCQTVRSSYLSKLQSAVDNANKQFETEAK